MEDQATASTVPVAEEVGQLYDRMTGLAVDFLGDDARCGYNAHLGYWDTPESELTYDEATDRLTDITTERLRIGAGSRLLDVGCGVGAPAARIARRTGAHVTGISVSREQIARADVLAREASLGDRLDFRLANAMELPFADASFDAVLALESMCHMPDRVQVLREMRRVVRPGGRIVWTDFYRRVSTTPARHALQRTMGSTTVLLDEYPPLLQASGLRFGEMLDITDETLPKSFAFLAERAEKLRFEFEDTEAACFYNPQSVIDVRALGYLLVVARRPHDD
ncbi:methyltransferase domain-containing protein [Streptomyces sp. SID3343]|uniref:SAM-dependent methyltransferase n=1 Tax=Streptomyces sp. SID3343 TaxID=2690260 RepID=UPI00136F676C|nr:methyltransferase domain-containing protein [Streptomyces sp. SID3343]MYW06300.1 methyltransferase domain-containing protein [Streptomyces sp. SID3343]